MEYRTLGGTGLEVSVQCLGTMMFGGWGNPDEDECVAMTQRALDAGINLVDTADMYDRGRSEEIVGKAIQGRRDEIVLATKVHNPMGEGRNQGGSTRYWIQKEVEASLRRLGTDHIDLYQVHRPDPATDLEETLGVLTDLVRQGKIRYLGSSTYEATRVVEAQWASHRRRLERFICEQPPYSILVRHIERDVLPTLERYRMGCIVWGPLNGGFLTGKYRAGRPEGSRAERFGRLGRHTAARFDDTRPDVRRKHEIVERLAAVADEAGLSLIELAMGFVVAHPAVTAAIIGPRTPAQLETSLAAADVRLDDATLDAIDEIVAPGTTVADVDRGWTEPGLSRSARRR